MGLLTEKWRNQGAKRWVWGLTCSLQSPLPGEPDCLLGHLGCGRGSDRSDCHWRGATRSHPRQPRAGPTQSAAATSHLQQPKLSGKYSRHRCEAWVEVGAGWVNRKSPERLEWANGRECRRRWGNGQSCPVTQWAFQLGQQGQGGREGAFVHLGPEQARGNPSLGCVPAALAQPWGLQEVTCPRSQKSQASQPAVHLLAGKGLYLSELLFLL